MCVNEEVKHVPEWAKQYVSDEELAMQDAEALRVAGDELAEKAMQLLKFAQEHITTADDLHEVFELAVALRRWRKATGGEDNGTT